jgi:hypothetical protein
MRAWVSQFSPTLAIFSFRKIVGILVSVKCVSLHVPANYESLTCCQTCWPGQATLLLFALVSPSVLIGLCSWPTKHLKEF